MGPGQLGGPELKISLRAVGVPFDDCATKQQIVHLIEPKDTTATVRLLPPEHHASSDAALNRIGFDDLDEELIDPFPAIGSRLLHFQLEEELGRGAFARVYLARQESLANRLVVLKVSTVHSDEPQTLARLRHTNIVPVYSVHVSGEVQVVCMPYLGRVTLAQVISGVMAWRQTPPEEGEAILAPLGTVVPNHELHHLNYVDGCLWVIGQLAAGLSHAHSRGVLHKDLKPANVLMTDDGVPMILDFNVASDVSKPSHECRVGGTLPYMSIEHLKQFLDEEATVDERSDLYSLGIILYQLLTGQFPFAVTNLPDREETIRRMIEQRLRLPEPVHKSNPAATPAIDGIVSKLLNPIPKDRYPSAEALCEDITRQLTHRQLAFAPDRSIRERTWKWRRRHPRLATGFMVAVTVLLSLILPASLIAAAESLAAERARQLQRTEAAIAADAAVADLHTAAVELGSQVDPGTRDQGLRTAKETIERYGVIDPEWKRQPNFALLDSARQNALTSAFSEVLVLMTRAEALAGGYSIQAVEAGLRWNSLAEAFFVEEDRPVVLGRHRVELEAILLGNSVPPVQGLIPKLNTDNGKLPERDADLYFDGLDLAAAGYYRDALPRLSRYCARHPGHFRAWFARGVCHDVLGQPADAATAFGICVALLPDFPTAIANRGIARLKQRRFQEAEADFNRSLELKPGWIVALLNRGIARLEQCRYQEAVEDFSAVLLDHKAPTRVYFLRSRARLSAGDWIGAEADRIEGMSREPRDPVSWAARGCWRMEKEPRKALEDYDAALKIDPTLRDALLNKAIILADYLHREAEAIPVLDQLLELYPDHVESRASRGVYLARLGRAAEAKRDAGDTLALESNAYRKYQIAGLYAQLARHDPSGPYRAEALRFLALAFRGGFENMKLLKEDSDLDPVRNDPEFKRIVETALQLTSRK
ncbi:MAG TPA: serine/threonine-protein kinase [Gemmata sp.]|nr:serine/threonine-protein kinase [Gemmata sp.]